ncbi:glycoside hydrolase family 1 protein [Conexibacter woesei]|uniref:glycoside hydrolase family 1 protein n=1 Tax=Conexibacter woesei TaxID=191495 RepID=UPI00042A5311|nr:family 1 glycosylhydrolase [Conexibacter woesei]
MSRVTSLVLLLLVALCCAAANASAQFIVAPPRPLPRSFLWGVSASAFQSEGHTTGANWNTYIARDSRPGAASPKEAYRNSVDFYTRYRSDIGLAAGLGVNTYRISINWTRVEPRPGVFSAKGLAFYTNVVRAMRAKGIQPLITLNHWDYPQWVLDQGGWTSTRTVDDFAAMTQEVVDRLGTQVHLWLTFNEEFFYEFVEQGNNDLNPVQVQQVRANLIAAHDRAYDIIHKGSPGAKVSSNYAWPGNGALASFATDPFTNAVAGKLDYLALDYYYPAYDQARTLLNISAGTSYNIALDPFGIYTALRQMHARYPSKPILISENGMPTRNGTRADGVSRSRALTDTVYWVQRARAAGVPVFGYLYWGLTDSYEWGSYTPRFGLYRVDVDKDPSLKRRPTAAVPVFRAVVRDRGVPSTYRLSLKPKAANCETTAVAAADKATCRAAAARG